MTMEFYRLRCRPRGAWLSPWQADTLFGELCWLVRYREGPEGLRAFLAPFLAGRPPFLLSNGFPGDLLPRPILPARFARNDSKEAAIAHMQAAKREKALRLLVPQAFHALRCGESPTPDGGLGMDVGHAVVLKNQINRLTGTTAGPDESGAAQGHLYACAELSLPPGVDEISVYAAAESAAWAARLERLFAEFACSGHGAKKSSGYGAFRLLSMEPLPEWGRALPGANGFVSLSNFCPAAQDPVNGYYEMMVKFGKLGEEYAVRDGLSPFKRPLLMVRAGAVFHDPTPRPWYGRMVRGLHPADGNIVQYAYALPLPMRLRN